MDGDYDRRATDYDDWWLRAGRHEGDPAADAWHAEVERLVGVLASLPPRRTLDVACGTGFLTRHLPGEVTGLDASGPMLEQARRRAPHAELVRGDALELPFADGAFERVFTSFFYGHLHGAARDRFLAEARRVGSELVVVEGTEPRHEQEPAPDRGASGDGPHEPGPRHDFDPDDLAVELGGTVLLYGERFVVVTA